MTRPPFHPHHAPPAVLRLGDREVPAYGLLGVTGLAAGIVLALALTALGGRPLGPTMVAILAGLAAAYMLTVVIRAVVGREMLVFYHYLLVVPAAGGAALALGGWPLLPYLEPLILGLGLLQAVGRWGCLCAGCCHGRPAARWLGGLAVIYGRRHAERGFPRGLVGVPLVPVQIVESGWAALVLILACSAAVAGPPGGGLVVYLPGYALGRFFLEWLRGDGQRPRALGLSEAQWTSLGVGLLMVGRVATQGPPTGLAAGALLAVVLAVVVLLATVGVVGMWLRIRSVPRREDARG